MEETPFTIITSIFLICCLVVLGRLVVVLPCCHNGKRVSNEDQTADLLSIPEDENKRKKLMILLGSGGHTGEMLRILSQWSRGIVRLDREYVISSGDSTSVIKLKEFEESIGNENDYEVTTIYRARNIGEGKMKAILNTFLSFKSAFVGLIVNKLNKQPDAFLTNGPGTAIPIAYMLFILKFFGLNKTKIIYVESLARVKELSLTGLLILPISDRIIVQWEPLSKKYKRCEYYGILV